MKWHKPNGFKRKKEKNIYKRVLIVLMGWQKNREKKRREPARESSMF